MTPRPPDERGSTHRYLQDDLRSDYLRAFTGLVICVGLIGFVDTVPVITGLAVAGSALFGYFGFRTWQRGRTAIVLMPDSISVTADSEKIYFWKELTAISLRYYAVRKDSKASWMELSLKFGRNKLAIESKISDFETIARAAAQAAESNRLPISDLTEANFAAIGLALADLTMRQDDEEP